MLKPWVSQIPTFGQQPVRKIHSPKSEKHNNTKPKSNVYEQLERRIDFEKRKTVLSLRCNNERVLDVETTLGLQLHVT